MRTYPLSLFSEITHLVLSQINLFPINLTILLHYLTLMLSSTISNSTWCLPLRFAMSYAVSSCILRKLESSHLLQSKSCKVVAPPTPLAAKWRGVCLPLVCALISAPFCKSRDATLVFPTK